MKASNWLKKSGDLFKTVFLNLVFLFLFLELGSAGFYFIKTKQLYYTRDKTQVNQSGSRLGINLDEARLDEGIVERLHPFFGYTMKPGLPFKLEFSPTLHKVNNYGFVSAYSYPVKKKSNNRFIVGVFGGSVANNYAIYESENKILAQKLKQIPALRNKEIVILPFATGGYKQPQQLLLLNYFLSIGQHFDAVVNIDGFNEVAISNLNNQEGIEVSMPSVQHVMPLRNFANNRLTAEELRLSLKIQQHKAQLRKALADLDTCPLASCYALTLLSAQFLAKSYQHELIAFDKMRAEKSREQEEDSLIQMNRAGGVLEDAIAFERMASLWSNSSRQMREVLAAKKILYFHFIQPNQYYRTQRVFSESEKKIAFIEGNPYTPGVTKGYPVLFSKLSELNKSGVNIFNAAYIFDDIKAPVYIDTCCHYNQTGSEIFSNYVANSIGEVLAKDPTFTGRARN
ncbi:MAG: hypothetical protein KME26_00315 [Oscillatoria princeps RMCB-10]|jgi:hypothetical protein|nr:hypothetical protein [Oscillatoria princeps RMCB-10]